MRFEHFTDIQKKKKQTNQNNPPVPKINPTSDDGSDHTWSHRKTELAVLLFWAHPTDVQWCISSSTCTSLSETSCWHHKYLKHFEWLFSYFYIELLHKYQFSNQCTIQNCFFKHHLGKENTICFKVTAFFFYLN